WNFADNFARGGIVDADRGLGAVNPLTVHVAGFAKEPNIFKAELRAGSGNHGVLHSRWPWLSNLSVKISEATALSHSLGPRSGTRPISGVRKSRLFRLGDVRKAGFQNIQPFVELFVGDHQRYKNAHHVACGACRNRDDAVLVGEVRQLFGLGIGGPARFAVAHQFDGAHPAENANLADQLPLLLPASGAFFKTL